MREAEWLACAVPGPMLAFLCGRGGDRKLLLFVAACLRRCPELAGGSTKRALEVVERRADGGEVSRAEWAAAWHAPWEAWDAAARVARGAARAQRQAQAGLLRCLFGNPF